MYCWGVVYVLVKARRPQGPFFCVLVGSMKATWMTSRGPILWGFDVSDPAGSR